MRAPRLGHAEPTGTIRAAATVARRPRRRGRPIRPIGDGTTEHVRVIEFLWDGATGVQPVLFLDRRLLD